MTPPEDTGLFAVVKSGPAPTLPPFPTPGPGAMALIALSVIALRCQGFDDSDVDQWRRDALAFVRSPSTTIPPEH